MDDWMASLPPDIAKAIKPDVIVTGGSIASMLLGEPINDYDIYLKTNGSALLLAEHYCSKFKERRNLKSGDVHSLPVARMYYPNQWRSGSWSDGDQKFIPTDAPDARVGIFVKSVGIISETSETTKEYGFFELQSLESTRMDEFAEEAFTALRDPVGNPEEASKAKYRPVFMSQNAITLSDKVQVVLRFTGNADKIHENFDYVHATNYYEYGSDKLTLRLPALECLLSKRLKYSGSLYPICSLFRMRKFLDRGWKISAGEITKMAFQISELDLKNLIVLREQLTGVDAAYFHQLIRVVYDSKKNGEDIDATYIMNIIDEMSW
jgi:hypothetical protein